MIKLKKYRTHEKDAFNKSVPRDLFASTFKTTYQEDFKRYADAVPTSYTYDQKRVEDPPKVVSRPYEREDPGTFAKFRKGAEVPMELYISPKPIIRTNPHKPFEELGELPKEKVEEAISSRPRIFMVPAIAIDNVKEPDREYLVSHIYISTNKKAEKEATAYFKPKKPKIDKIETGDVVLKYDYNPPLEEKFRKAARDWDNDQVRGDPDPTREFWIHKDPPVICGACVHPLKNIVPEDVKQVIKGLIKEEKLTLAHDMKPTITYEGFKPKLPMGIAMERKKLPTMHPLLSVAQSLTNRTPEEVRALAKIYDDELSDESRSKAAACERAAKAQNDLPKNLAVCSCEKTDT